MDTKSPDTKKLDERAIAAIEGAIDMMLYKEDKEAVRAFLKKLKKEQPKKP